jgi:hypothetical protein
MSIIGIIVVALLFGAILLFLNRGPNDKDQKSREAYWDKYEKK